ncbi:MAG: glucose-6-phosphate isomerase, partial [Campylobacterota bacterium]|nr:glucose-6-phosphate isomerase [Campylobacterota bacterium]
DTYIKNNKDLQENKITDIVVIGIGGSSLGTKAIDAILEHKKEKDIDISFLENGDPIAINKILKKIQKSSTIFIVISKSGTTIETTSIFKYVLKRFDIKLDSKDTDKLLAITDEDSPLWEFAKKYDIAKFCIPKNVGGRFSVLSAVGLVPLAIMGYDISSIIKGAAKFEKDFFNKKAMHLIEKAYFYYKQGKNKPINVLFSYSSQFDYFNQWYVQLWGESLGKFDKTHKKVGLTPVGLVGSVDQHSFLQLVMQGPEDKTLTFIKVEDFENKKSIPDLKLDNITGVNYINTHTFNELINAQCMATMESVSEAGIPTDMITVDKLNEENLGTLIYYYELLTSCVGVMFNINTYDQPGVEFGKKKLIKKFVKEN